MAWGQREKSSGGKQSAIFDLCSTFFVASNGGNFRSILILILNKCTRSRNAYDGKMCVRRNVKSVFAQRIKIVNVVGANTHKIFNIIHAFIWILRELIEIR